MKTKKDIISNNNIKDSYGFSKKTLIYLINHYEKYKNKYSELNYFLKDCKNIKQAIKNKKLLIVDEWNYTKFGVYIYGKDNPIYLNELTKRLIWYRYNKKDCTVTIGCYTSRPLEIISNLAYAVGLKFHETPQDQIIL